MNSLSVSSRTLARELNIFKHVCGDHAFCDGYLFYRFCNEGDNQIVDDTCDDDGALDAEGRGKRREPSDDYHELPFGLPAVMETDETEEKLDALAPARSTGPTSEDLDEERGCVLVEQELGEPAGVAATDISIDDHPTTEFNHPNPSVADAERGGIAQSTTVDLEVEAGDSSTSTEVEITNLAELPEIARRDSDQSVDLDLV